MTAPPASRVLLFLGACALISLAVNAPLLLKGVVVGWEDYAANLLERIAVGRLVVDHGWFHRFPLMLTGVDAATNGVDPKLDTLIFAALPPNAAALAFFLLRAFALPAGLGAILIAHYRVPAPLALAAGALATQGFNALNWFYFGPDYAGPAFLFGYQLAPLLVLPSLLVAGEAPSARRGLACFLLSALAGLLYAYATWFTLVVFTLPLAVVWIALIVERRALAWPVAGVVLGASLVTIAPVLDFFAAGDSVRRSLFSADQIMSLGDGIWYLLVRGGSAARYGLVLLAAAAICALRGGRSRAFAGLALLYALAMAPDVLMKTLAAQSGLLPPLLLSVNYYTYVVAPIFLCSLLAVGFSALPGFWRCASAAGLLALALHLSWRDDGVRRGRPNMRLTTVIADPALGEAQTTLAASQQRAAMVVPDEASLIQLDFQLPRPIDSYLHARGIATPGGYASNLDSRYSIFWSNVIRPPQAELARTPGVFLYAYVDIDVRTSLAVDAGGCLVKTAPLTLSDINFDLLRLAATRFLVSVLPLDDPRLRLVHEGRRGAIYCRAQPTIEGFNVYEIADAPSRISLAGEIHGVEDELAALAAMRASPAHLNDVWIAAADAKTVDASNLQAGSGKVSVVDDEPNGIVVRLEAERPTLLVVRDRRTPSARALVNGTAAAVVPANYVFMAVPVPAGASTVEIRY